jgi:hypothetical protein
LLSASTLRYAAATLIIFISGWLLLGCLGLAATWQDRSNGWQIYELPPHPVVRMTVGLTLGLTLPFLAALLITPLRTVELNKQAQPFLKRYVFSVMICFIATVWLPSHLPFLGWHFRMQD